MGKNIILVDWIQETEWRFQRLLNEYTLLNWTVVGTQANGSQNGAVKKFYKVYLKYFIFPFKIFLKRKRYENILSWQQFFGLIFAFYCNIFKVRNYPKIFVMTFIYKPKRGIVGNIYYNFIKSILNSKYIEKVICFSKSEVVYYSKLFNVTIEKFDYVIYAVDNNNKPIPHKTNIETIEEKYFLSVGRSNRDYNYLIKSLNNSKYNIIILCDKLEENLEGNIKIYNNIFGEGYLSYLRNCIAVIIPLEDENISSGQLVFLKAMEYGKPIIITKNNAVNEYIINDYNGIIINKNEEELISSIDKLLNDVQYYNEISNNAKVYYEENLSFDSFVKSIANILCKK